MLKGKFSFISSVGFEKYLSVVSFLPTLLFRQE